MKHEVELRFEHNMSYSERQWERMKWNWDDIAWDKMRGNDNKWGGMKMAFGKWEKNENMTMQEVKLRGHNLTCCKEMTMHEVKVKWH